MVSPSCPNWTKPISFLLYIMKHGRKKHKEDVFLLTQNLAEKIYGTFLRKFPQKLGGKSGKPGMLAWVQKMIIKNGKGEKGTL